MTVPSGRRMSVAVRTTTAFITWPFLTRPRGIASLTETTITSPTEAYLRCDPPSTLMHMTRLAPELSATSRLDCIWIMTGCLLSYRQHRHPARRPELFLLRGRNKRPALILADRRSFLDPHGLSDLGHVVLVVGVVLLGTTHGLLQKRMGETALDTNHDGLVIGVGDDSPLQNALWHGSIPYLAAFFSVRIVLIRAISRRTSLTRAGFSSCWVARWK